MHLYAPVMSGTRENSVYALFVGDVRREEGHVTSTEYQESRCTNAHVIQKHSVVLNVEFARLVLVHCG